MLPTMNVGTCLGSLLLACVVGVRSETFDYLIAGAGTAGLVVASRLSENPNVTVAVIEPGDDVRNDPMVTTIEFSFANLNLNASTIWQQLSVPQPDAGNRTFNYIGGTAIGGTSAINGMVYIRGDKLQYDAWEELGNEGWNWDSVFSYDKYSENFTIPTTAQIAAGGTFNESDHGYSGLLKVGYPFVLSNSSFYEKARQTWQSLGINPIEDINGGDLHGFVVAPETLDRDANVREDSARAYYEPVETRKNLKIIKGTVKRITWAQDNGEDAVADGFEYVDPSGNLVQIGAKKEVVVSASSYKSPLILESSGVGNPRILKKLGIEVKVELPGVGESMQDHQGVNMVYAAKSDIVGHTPYATLPTAPDVFGNQTSNIAASSQAKLADWAKAASAACSGAISAEAFEKRFQVQHDLIFKKNVTIAEFFPSTFTNTTLAQYWPALPFSYGSIHLGAADKFTEPVINARLLSVDFDVEMLTGLGRLNQKAYGTAPLSDLYTTQITPGFDKLGLDATDEQWEAWLRENTSNGLHTVGTCAMLPKELGGVVDSRVKVYGTQNVRVVDASIIPMLLTGHTTGPIYGVAEKAAALIKADGN